MIRKCIRLGLLLACVPALAGATKNHKPFQIYDFSKGVDTYHDPTTLPEGFVQNSLNMFFDAQAPGTKRKGYTVAWTTTTTQAFTGLWTYTDASNTTWQIVKSSTQLTASNLAGSVVKVSTVSASNLIGETNAFGNAFFVDQTQGVYYWNGTSTTYVTSSPKGSIITQFHNRLWVTGAAVPNGNQLYGSGYYSGTNWTTGLNATDPVQYSIGLQDNFDNTTAEYVYLDTLYLFKHYSIFALYGFDQTSFQISQLTQECGCIDGGTIQTYNGGLKFVSLRGVEDFNGYTCKRISDPVKNLVDPAIQLGGFSQQSWVQQNATDWLSGTISNLSTVVSPPNLVLSSFTFTDTDSSRFSQGTASSVTVNAQSIQLSVNNLGTVNDPGFETLLINDYVVGSFSQSNSITLNCTVTPHSGNWMARAASVSGGGTFNFDIQALDSGGNVLQTTVLGYFTSITPCTGWKQFSLTPSAANTGKRVTFKFVSEDFPAISIQTKSSYIWGGALSVYVNLDVDASNAVWLFDDIANGSSTIDTGLFTSRTFNIPKNTVISSSVSWTVSTSTPSFEIQTSDDGNAPWISLIKSSGTSIATTRQYGRYVSSFSAAGFDANSTIDDVNIYTTLSSGTFKSQIHNTGTMNSWGNFSVSETLNSGAIAFSVCSSTNSNMSVPVSCTNQTINSQIISSTGTYVQWYATFTVTAATQTPTLQSGTVQWFTGSNAIPMSSTVWDNRYWLSLTTTTNDSANDAVLVLNSRGAWAPLDLHVGSFTQYKNSLYHADSQASGNVYLDDQGYGDNGNPINAFIQTKDESLGDLAADDYLYSVYPSAANTGSCTMTVQYVLDKSTTTYSLGSPLLSEYGTMSAVRLPFPIDSTHMDFGQTVNFTVGTNDNSCAWKFYGLEGLFKSRPVQ